MPKKTPKVLQRSGGQARFEASKRGKSGAQPSERQLARWKVDAAMREIYKKKLDEREEHREKVKKIVEKHKAKLSCVRVRLHSHARMRKDIEQGPQEDVLTDLEKKVIVKCLELIEKHTFALCNKDLVLELVMRLVFHRMEYMPELSSLWWKTWKSKEPTLARIMLECGPKRRGMRYSPREQDWIEHLFDAVESLADESDGDLMHVLSKIDSKVEDLDYDAESDSSGMEEEEEDEAVDNDGEARTDMSAEYDDEEDADEPEGAWVARIQSSIAALQHKFGSPAAYAARMTEETRSTVPSGRRGVVPNLPGRKWATPLLPRQPKPEVVVPRYSLRSSTKTSPIATPANSSRSSTSEQSL